MTYWPQQDVSSNESPATPVQFSPFVTACFGVIFLMCLGFLVSAHLSMPRLDRIPSPDQALEIITNQAMGLRDGLEQVSDFEKLLMGTVGDSGGEILQCIEWYTELAEIESHPLSALHLAILEGEEGRTQSVQMKVHMWQDWAPPFPLYGRLLQAAYLPGRVDPSIAQELQAQLAEQVPNGWLYRQMALHIAERSQDRGLQASLQADSHRYAQRLLSNNRWLGGVQIMAVVGGLMAMVLLWRRWKWGGNMALQVGSMSFPPPWSGWNGMVVLVRGGGIASLLIIAISVTGLDPPTLQFLIPIFIHIPIIGLAYFCPIKGQGFF